MTGWSDGRETTNEDDAVAREEMDSTVESTVAVEPQDEGCIKSPEKSAVQGTQDNKKGAIESGGEDCRDSKGRKGTTGSDKIKISSDVGSQEEEEPANEKLSS